MAQDSDRRANARRGEGRPAVEREPLTLLVLDASALVQACLAAAGFSLLENEDLVAPPLLWSEALSAIHELRWRHEISDDLSSRAFAALLASPGPAPRAPSSLPRGVARCRRSWVGEDLRRRIRRARSHPWLPAVHPRRSSPPRGRAPGRDRRSSRLVATTSRPSSFRRPSWGLHPRRGEPLQPCRPHPRADPTQSVLSKR